MTRFSVFGSAIIRITYGLEVADKDDRYVQMAEEAIPGFNAAFMPGKYLVETFPIMRCIPAWFPGAKFKREANGWRPSALRMRNVPWEAAMEAIVCTTSLIGLIMCSISRVAQRYHYAFDGCRYEGPCYGRRRRGDRQRLGCICLFRYSPDTLCIYLVLTLVQQVARIQCVHTRLPFCTFLEH